MDLAQFVADARLSACTLGANTDPRDRITQNVYDAASQITQVKVAVGTTDAATERTLSYTNNGMLATLKDGENNLTTFEYDGFDRLSKTRFPSTTKGSGTSSATDYELLTYDDNSNITSRRQRDANTINFTYDDLDRPIWKKANNEAANTFEYDNLGRVTSAVKASNTQTFTYDALSRNLTQAGPQGTLTSEWDAAGRRIKLTYPGTGFYLNYDYLLTGEVTKVRENGASTGIGVLATYGYDDLGNRTSATYGNGASQAFGYDGISRLSSLTLNLSGTASDLTKTFAYNPASQIVTETRSNDAYAQAIANGSQTTATNGLNQLDTVNGTAADYDDRGNMILDPVTGKTYSYLPSNNQLYNIPTPFATFGYDALDRMANVNNGGTVTNYVTDGFDTVAEYNSSNVLQKRYAFDGSGWPLVQYDAAGNRSWMLADERGSIVALANDSAAMTAIDTYDEYGIPGPSNQGTFQYAAMMWLVRPGVYAPTYRAYNQLSGVFHQTDPIGFGGDGPNLYAYVLNDPVNWVDPLGLATWKCVTQDPYPETCSLIDHDFGFGGGAIGGGVGIGGGGGERGGGGAREGRERENDSCKRNGMSYADAARDVGEVVADIGTAVELGGLVVAIVLPPAGGAVALIGKITNIAGEGLQAGANISQGNYSALAGNAAAIASGFSASRILGRLGVGPGRSPATGRFTKNPFGGKFKDVKRESARAAAEKATGKGAETILCAK